MVKRQKSLLHCLNNNLKGKKKQEANPQVTEEVNLSKVPTEYKKFTLFFF